MAVFTRKKKQILRLTIEIIPEDTESATGLNDFVEAFAKIRPLLENGALKGETNLFTSYGDGDGSNNLMVAWVVERDKS